MIPPARTAVWSPVERLADLDVAVSSSVAGTLIELIDKRVWTELVSLPPAEAGALSIVLAERARRAGWVDPAGSAGDEGAALRDDEHPALLHLPYLAPYDGGRHGENGV